MKKLKWFFAIPAFVLPLLSAGQIKKGSWMLGGEGSISSSKTSVDGTEQVRSFSISISPDAGYFFADKLVGGLRGSNSFQRYEAGFVNRSGELGIGPFLRYYFLKSEKRVNVLAETSYQFLSRWAKPNGRTYNSNSVSFSAGPVIFLSPTAALELTAKYEKLKGLEENVKDKAISLNAGFQFHFTKRK